MTKSILTALCFALVLTWDNAAHAYLDGNSGSLIIQALIGGLVGMGVLLKMYWHAFLIKIGVKKVIEEETTEADTE
jgi:hypothetical protein